MLNQTVIVGRLVKDPELKITDTGKKVTKITLAVPRAFKNANGEYDTDFIDCILWDNVANNTAEYCHKGDIVGIKGRLQTNVLEKEDGKKENKLEIICEKITFLSSKPKEEE